MDNPTCVEIQQVCTKLGLESHIEADKCYSRNATMRGRVRVNLKDVKTGVPKNADVASRMPHNNPYSYPRNCSVEEIRN